MFEVLKRVFQGRGGAQLPDGSRHLLTGHDEINAVLHHAKTFHTLFSATLKNFGNDGDAGELGGHYTTALLGVFPTQPLIVLDELNPDSGHQALLEHGALQLEGRLQGVELAFETRLLKSGENRGVAYYHCSYPEQLQYLQRRQDFRISSGTADITFLGSRGLLMSETLRGRMYDISRNGVGVLLEGAQVLKPGDPLPACSLRLPDGSDLPFSLEVRYSARSPQRNITRLGGRFSDMDMVTRRRINGLISRLERAQVQRLRNR